MPVSHMMFLKSTLKPLGILGGIPLPPSPQPCPAPTWGGPQNAGRWTGWVLEAFFSTHPWAWVVLTPVRIAVHGFRRRGLPKPQCF